MYCYLLNRLYESVKAITKSRPDIEVLKFKHPWGQHSIIAHIPGHSSNQTIVIGAHQVGFYDLKK